MRHSIDIFCKNIWIWCVCSGFNASNWHSAQRFAGQCRNDTLSWLKLKLDPSPNNILVAANHTAMSCWSWWTRYYDGSRKRGWQLAILVCINQPVHVRGWVWCFTKWKSGKWYRIHLQFRSLTSSKSSTDPQHDSIVAYLQLIWTPVSSRK